MSASAVPEDRRLKPDYVASIARLLGAPVPPMAHGSREPKAILVLINDRLGLGLNNDLSKPELARQIAESAGVPWTPDCWSRGQILTTKGLARMEEAVRVFLAPLG